MNILIADDYSDRYKRCVDQLLALGLERANIKMVQSANEAHECLEANYYDLFILDILLPLWPESEPESRYSLDLLFEIHNGNSLHKPGRILGITADRNFVREAASSFEDLTWNVVEYSESTDDWLKQIINCAVYIMKKDVGDSSDIPTYNIDLAIICALEKPEFDAVLKLPWNWSASRPLDDVTFVRDGYFVVEGQKITVCATFATRMGMVSTALLSATVISRLRPRILVMCGVCAGVKGKVDIGDVLFADPAWDFQSGKRVRDKENTSFSIAPHQLPPPASIRSHLQQIRADKEALMNIATMYELGKPRIFNVVIGPVASGSAVLADGEVVNEIKSQHRDLVGVEMEIYGLYAAAALSSRPQPKAFALKGVCDFADPDKNDESQLFAAYTSANVLRLLMERYATRLLE